MPFKNPEQRKAVARRWREANPEYARNYYRNKAGPPRPRVTTEERLRRAREYQRQKRAERSARDQEAHIAYSRESGRRYRDRVCTEPSGRLWLTRAVRTAKQRARERGLEFNITAADLSMPATCPVLGIPISIARGTPTVNRPSLDRVDNTKGYVKGNVTIISWRANTRKNDMSFDEIRRIMRYMEAAELLS